MCFGQGKTDMRHAPSDHRFPRFSPPCVCGNEHFCMWVGGLRKVFLWNFFGALHCNSKRAFWEIFGEGAFKRQFKWLGKHYWRFVVIFPWVKDQRPLFGWGFPHSYFLYVLQYLNLIKDILFSSYTHNKIWKIKGTFFIIQVVLLLGITILKLSVYIITQL